MQGVNERRGRKPPEDERRIIDMAMDEVEVREPIGHGAEMRDVGAELIVDAVVESKAARLSGHEPRRRARITRCEQRDVMTSPHELFGEPRDDALGTSVELRRDALEQRGDLSDPHDAYQSFARPMPVGPA